MIMFIHRVALRDDQDAEVGTTTDPGLIVQMSGGPDLNRRPSAWEADILPLNYHRKHGLFAIPYLQLESNSPDTTDRATDPIILVSNAIVTSVKNIIEISYES